MFNDLRFGRNSCNVCIFNVCVATRSGKICMIYVVCNFKTIFKFCQNNLQDVDVVITFPHDAKETTVLWFKQKIEKIQGIILRTKTITITSGSKTKPNCYAFHLSASYKGYLQGLEQMQLPKPIKDELGGGLKEFSLNEVISLLMYMTKVNFSRNVTAMLI